MSLFVTYKNGFVAIDDGHNNNYCDFILRKKTGHVDKVELYYSDRIEVLNKHNLMKQVDQLNIDEDLTKLVVYFNNSSMVQLDKEEFTLQQYNFTFSHTINDFDGQFIEYFIENIIHSIKHQINN